MADLDKEREFQTSRFLFQNSFTWGSIKFDWLDVTLVRDDKQGQTHSLELLLLMFTFA